MKSEPPTKLTYHHRRRRECAFITRDFRRPRGLLGYHTGPEAHPGQHSESVARRHPLADHLRGGQPRERESISTPFGERGLSTGEYKRYDDTRFW